eukprot:TRINITY_DN18756_c0_g1_i2.p1 TRINITY_DN18756_c0_g1~~TRINITY_DN18756_c0_g1_i2.p1  ORF type:complete len:147 (+),score=19.51 TRINITY_DN18756_c0_g1_i2:863-1303(+)
MYVDTGANAHITNDPGNLYHALPYFGNEKVMIGDGSKLKISPIGDSSFTTDYGTIKLKDVLVVPNIKKNSISVSQLARDNSCIFEFSDSGFLIEDRTTGRTIATGSKKGNLYALGGDAVAAFVALRAGKSTDESWHQRLGHPNVNY